MFIIGKIFAYLLFPPGLFVLLAFAAAILAWRGKKKSCLAISLLLCLASYSLSTCICTNFLLENLEDRYPPLSVKPNAAAIVVLGGGYNEASPEYGMRGALLPVAEKRAIYGLELARAYDLPLVFSGGKGFDATVEGSEAEAAKRLWLSLGFDPKRIYIETESLDTKGNASGVAAYAKGKDIILVTSALHMPRSVMAFEKAGIIVIPAPTDYRAKRSPFAWTDFLPDASRLEATRFALHEYAGILYYRLTL
jgi:uncharacterized SAM-binding protein YcdF (DUF218 family)